MCNFTFTCLSTYMLANIPMPDFVNKRLSNIVRDFECNFCNVLDIYIKTTMQTADANGVCLVSIAYILFSFRSNCFAMSLLVAKMLEFMKYLYKTGCIKILYAGDAT